MGKENRETQTHYVSISSQEDSGGTARKVGEAEAAEESCIASLLRIPDAIPQAVKITLEDALSLLGKYVDERTPVRAVLGTPSVSIARVVGTISVSIVGGVPHLLIGKDDSESDQIKFRLSDCEFAYGDFRDATAEEFGAYKFEGFLVVGSKKGDTLSLFEMKS